MTTLRCWLLGALVLAAFGGCATSPAPVATAVTTPATRATKALPDGSLLAILEAETAVRRGHLERALALFAAQTKTTQSLALAKTTARLAQHLQQYTPATAALDLWLQHEPADSTALDIKARKLIADQDIATAFTFIGDHPQLAQQNLYALLATNTAKHKPDQLAALNTLFEHALQQSPDNIGLLLGAGLIQQTERFDYARALLDHARKLAPNNTVVLSISAALYAQAGQPDEAISLLRHGLTVQPEHFGIKRQLSRILAQTDIVAARTILKELIERAPNDSEVLFLLAQISMKLEFYQEAQTYLEQLQRHPQHQDYANYNLGLNAEYRQEHFIALNHYDAINSGPYLVPSLERYGKLAAQLSGIAAFEQRLAALKTNNPDQALALTIYHIEYLLGLGLNERTKPIIAEGLTHYRRDSKLLYAQFLVAESEQNYSVATAALRAILAQQPDNPVILNALGYTLTRFMNRHTEAKPFIEQALALKPNDAAIIDSMGWVLLKLGDISAATRHFMRAYAQSTDAEIAAHLGEALWLSNDHEQALSIWLEAYKIDANNAELQDVLRRFKVELPAP